MEETKEYKRKFMAIPQWMPVLNYIFINKKTYIAGIVREMKLTYSHVYNIVIALEEEELLNIEKVENKRKNSVSLTKTGRELGLLVNKLLDKINGLS